MLNELHIASMIYQKNKKNQCHNEQNMRLLVEMKLKEVKLKIQVEEA